MSSDPLTKQDLADAVQQVVQITSQSLADAVRQIDDKFSRELAETRDQLTEAIRDSQTEVLRAFYEWARPVETRLRTSDDLAKRMGWLEDRVSELERGKLPSTH